MTESFMSGDPYKGTERTAGVRATHRYITMHEQVYAHGVLILWDPNIRICKSKKKHSIGPSALYTLDIRGAQNLHSYNEGKSNTKQNNIGKK